MANVVQNINSLATPAITNQLMIVTDVIKGEAVELQSDHGLLVSENIVHTTLIPYLNKGDRVLVQLIANEVIITNKLRTENEKITTGFEIQDDGSLVVSNGKSIVLKTSHSKIEVYFNGKIEFNGKEIYSVSKGLNRLQGSTIELN